MNNNNDQRPYPPRYEEQQPYANYPDQRYAQYPQNRSPQGASLMDSRLLVRLIISAIVVSVTCWGLDSCHHLM